MIGNAAIFNWSVAYEKEYLEEIMGRFVGIGEEDEIERTMKLFSDSRAFVWKYTLSIQARFWNFTGDGPLQESERIEICEHARSLL